MRVFVVSSYFWPEVTGPAPYVTGPVRYLAERGHELEVWTGFAHYPSWRPLQPRALARSDELDGIRIHRRLHYIPRRHDALRRGVYEATLLTGALSALAIARRPDVVLGVTPTFSGAVAAAVLAARFRAAYALLVHDLMSSAAEQSGVSGGTAVAGPVRKLELSVARRATRIGVIAEGFREYFVAGGVSDERIVRLRTWTLGSRSSISREITRARLGWQNDEFVVVHGGNIGHKQGLDNVLRTAELVRGQGVRFVLVGDGNDRARLEASAAGRALRNVAFMGSRPWGEYEAILEAADALLVNQRPAVGDMSLPSKLTAYFCAGRPTIGAVAAQSETARELELSGGGVLVPPDDPRALADAMFSLRSDRDLAEALSSRARRYAERLRPSIVLPEYESFLHGTWAAAAKRRHRN